MLGVRPHRHRKGQNLKKKHKRRDQFRMKEHTSLIKKKFIFEKSNKGFLRNMALKSLLSKKKQKDSQNYKF